MNKDLELLQAQITQLATYLRRKPEPDEIKAWKPVDKNNQESALHPVIEKILTTYRDDTEKRVDKKDAKEQKLNALMKLENSVMIQEDLLKINSLVRTFILLDKVEQYNLAPPQDTREHTYISSKILNMNFGLAHIGNDEISLVTENEKTFSTTLEKVTSRSSDSRLFITDKEFTTILEKANLVENLSISWENNEGTSDDKLILQLGNMILPIPVAFANDDVGKQAKSMIKK